MEKKPKSNVKDFEDEEIATEITPIFLYNQNNLFTKAEEVVKGRSTSGIAGIVLSVLSLFMASLILAPIGIILGYIAHRKGDILGLWSIVISVFSLLGTILLISFI